VEQEDRRRLGFGDSHGAAPVEEVDAIVRLDDDDETIRLNILVRRGRGSRVEPQIVGRDGHEG
jgi:hypothetical protein